MAPVSEEPVSAAATAGGLLELSDVHFSYPERPGVAVLKGLSLVVERGTAVALCGDSGSGKSTVISLLERFYDASKGRIAIDGVDIRQLPLDVLRQQLGLVSQEPVLFEGSIHDNISYGR